MEPKTSAVNTPAPIQTGAEGMTVTPMTVPQQETASHVGERGFDTLNTPLGTVAVVLALLVLAVVCYWGSRAVRVASRKGEDERRAYREALIAQKAAQDAEDQKSA